MNAEPNGKDLLVIKVVEEDEDLLDAVLSRIVGSQARQVLVTGREAQRTFADKSDRLAHILGDDWVVMPHPGAPTRNDMISHLRLFAQEIHKNPLTRRLCYRPTHDEDVVSLLFHTSPAGDYTAAVFVLGLYRQPITQLDFLQSAVNREGKAPGYVESIVSAEDSLLLIEHQQELRRNIGEPDKVRGILSQAMSLLERRAQGRIG